MKQHTYAISLNHVIVRLSKIINNFKDLKILIFKVNFSVEKWSNLFLKKYFQNIRLGDQLLSMAF